MTASDPQQCVRIGNRGVTVVLAHFSDSLQHILAELERIDLLIRAQVWRARHLQEADAEFRGMYISEAELERLLARSDGLPQWATEATPLSVTEFRAALQRMSDEIERRRAATVAHGVTLRLDSLVSLFGLTEFDRDALLICLAPELDLRYERLFAYLHDDVNKKRPTVDLILNLLSASHEHKLAQRERFLPSAPLRSHRLVELVQGADDVLLSKSLRLDPRIANYLLKKSGQAEDESAQEAVSEQISSYVRPMAPTTVFSDLVLPEELQQKFALLSDPSVFAERGLVFSLQGPYGVGKQAVAEAICTKLALSLLWVDIQGLVTNTGASFAELVRLVMREALLRNAAIFFAGFDALLTEDRATQLRTLTHELEHRRGLSILAGEERWTPVDALRKVPFLHIELPRPAYADRLRLWQEAVDAERCSWLGNQRSRSALARQQVPLHWERDSRRGHDSRQHGPPPRSAATAALCRRPACRQPAAFQPETGDAGPKACA